MSATHDYTTTYSLQITLRGESFPVILKPGMPDQGALTPAARLLAETTALPPKAHVLLFGCGCGATPLALARQVPGGRLWLRENNQLVRATTQATLLHNQIQNTAWVDELDLPASLVGSVEAAFVDLPRGRKLARRWIYQAFLALREGGALFLAGSNANGVRPLVGDAQALFGEAAVLGYKKGSRIVRFTRPSQPPQAPGWWSEDGVRPASWCSIEPETGLQPGLVSLPGVFSFERVDDGTRLLLGALEPVEGKRLLDLGCGYGLIGLTAARRGAAWVDLLDSNRLAVACARENLRRCDIQNARVFPSDILEALPGEKYDLILSNPPFHSGREVDFQIAEAFISQSRQALSPGGVLIVVANRFIRYERLLGRLFAHVEVLAANTRYHVLKAAA